MAYACNRRFGSHSLYHHLVLTFGQTCISSVARDFIGVDVFFCYFRVFDLFNHPARFFISALSVFCASAERRAETPLRSPFFFLMMFATIPFAFLLIDAPSGTERICVLCALRQ